MTCRKWGLASVRSRNICRPRGRGPDTPSHFLVYVNSPTGHDWLRRVNWCTSVLGAANASPGLVDHVWESGRGTRPIARLSSALSTPTPTLRKWCFVWRSQDRGHKTDIRFLSVCPTVLVLVLLSWSCCPVYSFIPSSLSLQVDLARLYHTRRAVGGEIGLPRYRYQTASLTTSV